MAEPPALTGPLFELLHQYEELSRLAEDIRRTASRIAAMRQEHEQEGPRDDRPNP